jgi:hypothetical protein
MHPEAAARFAWQALCIPQMKAICGRHLIGTASYDEDTKRNTDLIVLRLGEGGRIACRVRTYEQYRAKYGDQFTIRASLPNGGRTELAKVLDGWGDYLLYGFARRSTQFTVPRFQAWTLAHLDVFRAHYRTGMGKPVRNPDGTQGRAFEWAWFPPEFVIATSRTEQAAMN